MTDQLELFSTNTLPGIIVTHNVSMECTHKGLATMPNTNTQMRKWICAIESDIGKEVVDFYMGTGLGHEEPTFSDVIGSMVCDARCASDWPTAHEFMTELGYEDYEQARNVMIGCLHSYNQLVRLFGLDLATRMISEMEIE